MTLYPVIVMNDGPGHPPRVRVFLRELERDRAFLAETDWSRTRFRMYTKDVDL